LLFIKTIKRRSEKHGVDVKSAQRIRGHADINVTLKIYTHPSEQKEYEASNALNTHLGGVKEQRNIPDAVKNAVNG
jgi:hypothetical protein